MVRIFLHIYTERLFQSKKSRPFFKFRHLSDTFEVHRTLTEAIKVSHKIEIADIFQQHINLNFLHRKKL